jgi:Tol biopolymer transport system component
MWTRDGKYILLDAWRQKEGATHAHIYQVNADGTWPVDLGPGAMPSRHPSEKGQLATHYYGDMRGVWLGTEKKIQIDPDSGSPRWHPYEPKIAYVKWSGGIAMRSFTGGELGEEEIIVPAEYAPYVGFSWAPDGKAIAFYSNRNGNDNSELLVLNVANPESEPEVKDSGKVGWILSWSPDGKKIAYSNYCEDTKTRQLFIVAPSTNDAPYRLEGQDKTRHNGSPAWSPDGKQIVFSSSEAKKAVVKD